MSNKIKIKVGAIEVEYEGSEAFIKNDLLDLVSSIAEVYKVPLDTGSRGEGLPLPPPSSGSIQGTTGSIASKLLCKSGPDLIIAAMANLILVQGIPSSHRKDILKEMKTASAYYKQSYLKNYTSYLNNLVKSGKILETSKDIYSLEAKTLNELEGKLAS